MTTIYLPRGRRRGSRRGWLTELRLLLDRAADLRFPTHRKDLR